MAKPIDADKTFTKDELQAATGAGAAEGAGAPRVEPKPDLAAFSGPITDGLNKLVDIAAAVKDGRATVDQIKDVVRQVIDVLGGVVQDRAAPAKGTSPAADVDATLAAIARAGKIAAEARPPDADKAPQAAEGAPAPGVTVEALQASLEKSEKRIADLTKRIADLGGRVDAPAGIQDVTKRDDRPPEEHEWPTDLGRPRGGQEKR